MKAEIKEEWLRRLRSGEIEQGRGRLHDMHGRQCCLGVLSEMAYEAGAVQRKNIDTFSYGNGPHFDSKILHVDVRKWAGLPIRFGSRGGRKGEKETLASLNDSGITFATIANIIEREF